MATLEAAVRDMQPRLEETEKESEERRETVELRDKQLESFEEQKKLLGDRNVLLLNKCENLNAELSDLKEKREAEEKKGIATKICHHFR